MQTSHVGVHVVESHRLLPAPGMRFRAQNVDLVGSEAGWVVRAKEPLSWALPDPSPPWPVQQPGSREPPPLSPFCPARKPQ